MIFCEYLFNFCCCCCYSSDKDDKDKDKDYYKILGSTSDSFSRPIYIHDIYENDLLNN